MLSKMASSLGKNYFFNFILLVGFSVAAVSRFVDAQDAAGNVNSAQSVVGVDNRLQQNQPSASANVVPSPLGKQPAAVKPVENVNAAGARANSVMLQPEARPRVDNGIQRVDAQGQFNGRGDQGGQVFVPGNRINTGNQLPSSADQLPGRVNVGNMPSSADQLPGRVNVGNVQGAQRSEKVQLNSGNPDAPPMRSRVPDQLAVDTNNSGTRSDQDLQINQGTTYPKLVDDKRCQNDIKKYCKASTATNMNVLECLQNNPQDDEVVSNECQHAVWVYKRGLTGDLRFDGAAGIVCKQYVDKITECGSLKPQKGARLEKGQGLVVPCLIDHMDEIDDGPCKNFLKKMETVVFSDYRLVYKLLDACDQDITKRHCGRIEDDDDDEEGATAGQKRPEKPLPHGDTIACLSREPTTLQPTCLHQILRVAELQADDFNKDRKLWFACRSERDKLCSKVVAGSGRVYKCLFQNKFHPDMGSACQKRLTDRQTLERANYKVNRGLSFACKEDIVRSQCAQTIPADNKPMQEVTLSSILLCLEDVSRKGGKLTPECASEIKDVRRSLMSDYQLNPEITVDCLAEIEECSPGGLKERGGKTLHCLMDHARAKPAPGMTKRFSIKCKMAIMKLMKEVNVRENAQVDPVLQEACMSVINLKCSDVQPGEGKIIDCLMDFVDTPKFMTDLCKKRLMEIQYFVSRDFHLSVGFYRACKVDLQTTCSDSSPSTQLDAARQSEVLFCLYRFGKQNKISPDCAREAKKMMMERAKSVDLEPDVEETCMQDLAQFCSNKTEKNDEMECLEDKLDSLTSEECKKVVKRYVEEEEEEPELNEVFRKQCGPVIKNHCQTLTEKRGDSDDDDDTLMQCLIKHKDEPEVTRKCLSHIVHHQIITLKDWNLSLAFKVACKESAESICSEQLKSGKKSDLVTCLSESVRRDTSLGKTVFQFQVSKPCRNQLKFEFLQRSENIQLDPDLNEACATDVNNFCPATLANAGRSVVITCLRKNKKQLSSVCHELIFKREVQEANDPSTDFMLVNKCKRMTKKYCLGKTDALFSCLIENKGEADFDRDCLQVLISRERIRSEDVRLNPELMRDCNWDIQKHCGGAMNKSSSVEMQGSVLYCLRKVFSAQRAIGKPSRLTPRLNPLCWIQVKRLISESVLDHMQDQKLVKACSEQIQTLCLTPRGVRTEMGDQGEVVNCLKASLRSITDKACQQEVVRVMAENNADVQVDPNLYRACSSDIQGSCRDVQPGEGRQIACLLEVHNAQPMRLRPDCNQALSDRIQLWDVGVKMVPIDSVSAMIAHVTHSSARNYLVAVLCSIVGVIFLFGIVCGRVTKRAAAQLKNR